jgi:outer membrane lipopolysaccharide assembly protein LptE/RlpB
MTVNVNEMKKTRCTIKRQHRTNEYNSSLWISFACCLPEDNVVLLRFQSVHVIKDELGACREGSHESLNFKREIKLLSH